MSAIFMGSGQRDSSLRRQRTRERDLANITEGSEDETRKPKLSSRRSTKSLSSRETSITIPPTTGDENEQITELHKSFLEKTKDIYNKLGLKHFVPFIILVLYSFGGAFMFKAIEEPAEQELIESELIRIEENREVALSKLRDILVSDTMTTETKMYAGRDVLVWYENALKLHDHPAMPWDIWGALFYVGTIYTTIGYGNIYPRTTTGQVLTIAYAIIGIPLVLAFLNNFGKILCRVVNKIWKKGRNLLRSCRIKRKSPLPYQHHVEYKPVNGIAAEDKELGKIQFRLESTETEPDSTIINKMIETDDDDDDDDEYESEAMPVSLALCLCVLWMVGCAAMFCIWETNWTFFQSFYFFFVSLSTIGLGDITPDHPKYMIFTFWLVLIGLSLVSMLISVIQMKIEEWLYRLMRKMQEEYERAMQMGEGPDKDKIMAKLMQKQPWYVRKMMPALMSEKQTEKLEQMADDVARVGTNSKSVQTDIDNEPIASETIYVQTEIPLVVDVGLSPDLLLYYENLQNSSSQTDTRIFENKEVQVNPRKLSLFAVQKTITELDSPNDQLATKQEKGIQTACQQMTDHVVQTILENRNSGTQTIEQVTIRMPSVLSRRSLIKAKSSDWEDSAVQTELMAQSNVFSQTNESYLRIARRLDQLRTNQAPGLLAISASPPRKFAVSAPPSENIMTKSTPPSPTVFSGY